MPRKIVAHFQRLSGLLLLLLMCEVLMGRHLVGGDATYRYIGPVGPPEDSLFRYEISINVYRDCIPNPPFPTNTPFDRFIRVGFFDGETNEQVDILTINLVDSAFVDLSVNDPCTPPPTGICYVSTTYRSFITLRANPNGYVFSWGRCCRNETIKNLFDPGNLGMVLTGFIPDPIMRNSSAVFREPLPTYICVNDRFEFDHSATDADGDSLAYLLTRPRTTGSRANPQPPPSPPPFANVIWQPPYSLNNPMDGNPGLSIDPVTGLMEVKPDALGQYVFSVTVREYRDGAIISEVSRDIQVNVIGCAINFPPEVERPTGVEVRGDTLLFRQGETGCFDIGATDVNGPGVGIDQLTFSAKGPAITAGASFLTTTGTSPLASTLCWTPPCENVLPLSFVVFEVEDDNDCPGPNLTLDTMWVKVLPAEAPPPDLRCVSVLGPDEISLSWIGLEPDQLEGFVAYYIDRQVGVDWVRVATISDPAQSTFTETGLPNAYENPYCYRMSSARICPEFIEGPSGEEVCSVVATATYFSEVQSTIDWNKYQGWENPVYTLFATDPAAGTIVDTDITDSSYLFKACEFNGRLRVQTIDPLSGCEVFSGFTDTVVHQNMFPSLSDLCRITVEEGNAGIRLNWQSFGADDFGAYLIYRRAEDEENFTLLTTVTDEGQLTYLDTSATVNQQVYCYKIVVEDLCEAQVESGVHCSMKLEADLLQDQYAAEMKWTPYTGWSVGVNRYELWDNNNTTEAGRRVATFSPGEFDYRDEDIRDEQAVYCYQVRAFKDGSGCGVESRSNEQCIIFPPRIFVPSAFSPNGDGHNDEFMVSSIFIRSMELRVFSRWGQEIFFTNSPGRGWDGTFNGKPVPEGVYTYLLRVDSFDRPSFQRGGTITLIR